MPFKGQDIFFKISYVIFLTKGAGATGHLEAKNKPHILYKN